MHSINNQSFVWDITAEVYLEWKCNSPPPAFTVVQLEALSIEFQALFADCKTALWSRNLFLREKAGELSCKVEEVYNQAIESYFFTNNPKSSWENFYGAGQATLQIKNILSNYFISGRFDRGEQNQFEYFLRFSYHPIEEQQLRQWHALAAQCQRFAEEFIHRTIHLGYQIQPHSSVRDIDLVLFHSRLRMQQEIATLMKLQQNDNDALGDLGRIHANSYRWDLFFQARFPRETVEELGLIWSRIT